MLTNLRMELFQALLRTQNDEKYRDVEVSAVQEVEVVPGPELDVGAEPHDDEAGQREQEVEDEDDVLDAGVATRVHGAAGAGTLIHCSTAALCLVSTLSAANCGL